MYCFTISFVVYVGQKCLPLLFSIALLFDVELYFHCVYGFSVLWLKLSLVFMKWIIPNCNWGHIFYIALLSI